MVAFAVARAPCPPVARRSSGAGRAQRAWRTPARLAGGGPSGGGTGDPLGAALGGGLRLLEWSGAVVPQGTVVTGVKGAWRAAWVTLMRELAPQDASGSYARPEASFTGEIEGDSGARFGAGGRYVLYVGNACPWCHRVVLAAALRGIQEPSLRLVRAVDDPERASRGGWVFDAPEPLFGSSDLRQVYDELSPGGYYGRCTAPLLVDVTSRRAVSNDSAAIVRSLRHLPGESGVDLYPSHLRSEIDAWCVTIGKKVNAAVYRCGFATTQAGHDAASKVLYEGLDAVEAQLAKTRFVAGNTVTEADVFLLPTILRYDLAYAGLFKCSGRNMSSMPNIRHWLRDMWSLPGVAQTFDADAARASYYGLFPLNPSGIVPAGPTRQELEAEWSRPFSSRELLAGGEPKLWSEEQRDVDAGAGAGAEGVATKA